MVSMTRSFLTSDPPVYESEGIKCYALCPGFVETNLVQKALADKGMTNQDLTQRTKMRVMTTKEIDIQYLQTLYRGIAYVHMKYNLDLYLNYSSKGHF